MSKWRSQVLYSYISEVENEQGLSQERSALVRNIQEKSGRMKFMLHARCTLWQEELETFRKMHSISQLFSFRKLEI